MSIARDIVSKLEGVSAVTLEYGYALKYDGSRVLFPIGSVVKERRNAHDRCTYLECTYDDGSVIVFRWSENRGPKYTVKD